MCIFYVVLRRSGKQDEILTFKEFTLKYHACSDGIQGEGNFAQVDLQ